MMNYNDLNPQDLRPVVVNRRKKSSFGKTLGLLLTCTIVGGGAGVGGAMFYGEYLQSANGSTEIFYTTPPLEATKVVSVSTSNVALPDLYSMNVGSTVGITVSATTSNMFGQPTTSAATGSGFVISSDGYIVTNYHVIEEAALYADTPVEVNFQNGDSYTATIVGHEEDNDLAVLKINATGLTPVVFGDSDSLVVGETVVAIGNPLGELDFSFTDGIVSAKDRLISVGDDSTMNMLQTNTAINPGNSGGPLFDGQGALIGINTAKFTTSSGGVTLEGIGFAIPINDVKDMITDIIENGYVTGKPYIGVVVQNVPTDAQNYGIVAGASVNSVAEGGAAQRAGIQANDIITAIDDTAIDSSSALTAALIHYRAGDSAVFTIVRNQQELKITVTFDEKNDETQSNNVIPQEEEETNTPSRGNGSSSSGNSYDYWSQFPFDSFFP